MDTSPSLLDLLREQDNHAAWGQLVELYQPLIHGWLRRHGAPLQELDDLTQEVMTVVVRRIGEFERQPQTGAFRSWLRVIAVNCLRAHWRRNRRQPVGGGGTEFGAVIEQLADPHSGVSRVWNQEHDRRVTEYLLNLIRPSFSERTWQAFQRFALDGAPAETVATELGMSANAVFIAKSRVLALLRKRGQGILEER